MAKIINVLTGWKTGPYSVSELVNKIIKEAKEVRGSNWLSLHISKQDLTISVNEEWETDYHTLFLIKFVSEEELDNFRKELLGVLEKHKELDYACDEDYIDIWPM